MPEGAEPMAQFSLTLARLARLARFDMGALDEIRRDRGAIIPAFVVVIAAMLLFGVGSWLWGVRIDPAEAGAAFFKTVLIGTLFALALWLAWLLVVYLVLLQVARVMTPVDQLLRAAGFAAAPLALGPLMVVPGVSMGVALLVLGGWLLFTQSAVERCAPRAGGVAALANLAGFAVWVGVMSVIAMGGEPLVPGPFLREVVSGGK